MEKPETINCGRPVECVNWHALFGAAFWCDAGRWGWLLLVVWGLLVPGRTWAGGTWTPLAHPAPGAVNLMLLLSDGTVMAANNDDFTIGKAWFRLTPDSHGSYANGTWTTLASMYDTRLFYSSAVLRDGRVLVAGGEYGTGTNAAEVYDPLNNTWTQTGPPPAGQIMFDDSDSKILPNGNVLVSPVLPSTSGGTVIYNVAANAWINGPTLFRGSYQDEASWVKLPDDSILTIDPFGVNSERYIPSSNTWINDGVVPVSVYDPFGSEMGAAILLPDGRAFFMGATGHTALYTPSGTTSPGTWAAGPDIPNAQGTPDAAAAMMVNGKILCAVSPLPTSGSHFPMPTSIYEYDYVSNSFTLVSAPTGATGNYSSFSTMMLDLPDGTVLFSNFGSQLYVYQPDGSPLAAGQPTITGITTNLDGSYHLTGTLLNGISEGAAYGDDAQMNSNYPLIRMTNSPGTVYYARTFNWSSTGVMTGNTPEGTDFTLPAGLPLADYSLVVTANGNSSDPVPFLFSASSPVVSQQPQSQTVIAGANVTFSVTVAGTPLSYFWQRNGVFIPGATNATYTTNNVQLSNSGLQFSCLVSNVNGTTLSSNGILTVLPGLPPVITVQPANLTVSAGNSATFSVTATSTVPISYFWQRNNVFITGATGSTYTTNNVQESNSGAQFSCLVSNMFGATPSSNAVLTVTPPSLIQNGGFETGNFTGWTLSGNTGSTSVAASGAGFIHSGGRGAKMGPVGSLGFFSQTVPTIPGQPYLLSLWLSSPDGQTPTEFLVKWNGQTNFDQVNIPNIGWTNLQFIVTATASSTLVQFGFRDDPTWLGLDDISLNSVPVPVVQSTVKTNGGVKLNWNASTGLVYQVQYKTNLAQVNWINMGGVITATNNAVNASDVASPDPQRFYRVQLLR